MVSQNMGNMIYNIRPNTTFKHKKAGPFSCKEDFLTAIYETLVAYKGRNYANDWLNILNLNYFNYYGNEFKLTNMNTLNSI